MIVCIQGVKGGADLSSYVDREGSFEIEASLGNRMDTLHCTLWDPDLELFISDRAEIVVYDAMPGSIVVDPTNTPAWAHNGGLSTTSDDPTQWTRRLYAGYMATAQYSMFGAQRQIVATAQDYTFRNKATIINKSFTKGLADSDIIKQLYSSYRPDIDTTNVVPVIHALAEGAMTYTPRDIPLFIGMGTDSDGTLAGWQWGENYSGTTPTIQNNVVTLSGTHGAMFGVISSRTMFTDMRYQQRFLAVAGAYSYIYARIDYNNTSSNLNLDVSVGTSHLMGQRLRSVHTTLGTLNAPILAGLWYWAVWTAYGSTHTASLYTDSNGAVGTLLATTTATVSDPILATGSVGMESDNADGIWGGAYPDTSQVTTYQSSAPIILDSAQKLGSGVYGYLQGSGPSYGSGTIGSNVGGTSHYATDSYSDPVYKNTGMPSFRFGTHTLEQMMGRITKLTHGQYRIDYYKRLFSGPPGTQRAPFDLSDTPVAGSTVIQSSTPLGMSKYGTFMYGQGATGTVGLPAVGMEQLTFNPDASGLVNRVWVVGGQFTSEPTNFIVQPNPNGFQAQFLLPATPTDIRNSKVTANTPVSTGDMGSVGVLGLDGTIDAPQDWPAGIHVMLGDAPAIVAFHPLFIPLKDTAITVITKFRYPVVEIVTDQDKVLAANGNIFEGLLRDKRIADETLAAKAGAAYLTYQGSAHKGGTCVIRTPGLTPGHTLNITHKLFTGLLPQGSTTLNAVINHMTTTLDGDTVQPYAIKVDFADLPELDASQGDIVDMALSEAGRVNAALDQTTVEDIVQDIQILIESFGFQTESIVATGRVHSDYLWSATDAKWGFSDYVTANLRSKSFAASLTPSGKLFLPKMQRSGAVSFSGTLTMRASGPGQLAGSITLSGQINSRYVTKSFAASLTPTATTAGVLALNRTTSPHKAASLTMGGQLLVHKN